MTGTADAILQALKREIDQHRTALDESRDVGEVVLRVRLNPGTASVRAVSYMQERFLTARDRR